MAGRMRLSGQAALSVNGDGWHDLPDDVDVDEPLADDVGDWWQ